jgi:chromosome segregation ATPase
LFKVVINQPWIESSTPDTKSRPPARSVMATAQEVAEVLDKLRETADAASSAVTERRSEVKDLKGRIQSLRQRCTSSQKLDLVQRAALLSAAQQEAETVRVAAEAEQSRLTVRADRLESDSTQERAAREARIEAFLRDGEAFRQESSDTAQSVQQLYQRLAQKRTELEAIKSTAAKAGDDVAALKKQKEDAVEQLKSKKRELETSAQQTSAQVSAVVHIYVCEHHIVAMVYTCILF